MKNMKKILIGVAFDGKGGIDNYILEFVKTANKKNIQCDVLTTKPDALYNQKLKSHNAKLIKISNLHNKKNIYSEIAELHKKNKYDAAYWNISTSIMYPYLKATKRAGIKCNAVHSHAANNDKPSAIKNKVFDLLHYLNKNKICSNANIYLACSSNAAKWMFNNKIINNKEYHFIPNPIDVTTCRFSKDIRKNTRKKLNLKDETIIGCVSAFRSHKNSLFLIDVFKEYYKINKNSKLLICADGPLKNQFLNKAQSCLPKNTYEVLGFRNDVAQLLQAFDLYVFPSKIEGFGMSLVEAQASGLKCIFGNGIPTEAQIIKNQCFKIENYDAKSWAKKMSEIGTSHKRNEKAWRTISDSGFNLGSPEKALKLLNI